MPRPTGALTGNIQATEALGGVNPESFAYDGQGNLRFITDRKGQVIEFQYDAADRRTAKIMQPGTPDEAVRDFGYDPVDNIRTVADPDSSLTMNYDGAGRLLSVATTGAPFQPAVTVAYTYDLNGNRLTMDDGVLGITDYVPDLLNRPTSITAPGQAAITLGYDALSRRRTVTRPNGVDSTNTLLARYTHGPDIDEPLVMERDLDASGAFEAAERFTYHADGLGSITELTDSTGAVARTYAYDAYGQIAVQAD